MTLTNKEVRYQIAEEVEKLGYTGCANQIRANLKPYENAIMVAKGNTKLLQIIKQLLPKQTEKQNIVYNLFDIELGNELFRMYTGYSFINAEQVPVNKESSSVKYSFIKNELLSMIKPSEELDVLFSKYECAAKEEYLIYAKTDELSKKHLTRDEYMSIVIPLDKQAKELERVKTAVKIDLANYLMDNII